MEKLLSRKFLVTIVTLAAALTGLNLDTLHLAIVAGVAGVYVIAEALVDHAGVKQIADDVQRGLQLVGSIDASKLDAGTIKTLIEKFATPASSSPATPQASSAPAAPPAGGAA